jgi:hypothetical protein
MEPNTPRERTLLTSLSESFDRYLQDKGKGRGGGDGNYRRNVARELDRFAEWAAGERGDEDWTGIIPDDVDRDLTFEDLNERVFREYARYLSGDRGLKQNTVQTYYAYISAWCGWCVNEGYLEAHYAQRASATAPLPENDGRKPGDRQALTSEQRHALTRHVDEQAREAVQEHATPSDHVDSLEKRRTRYASLKAARDRALVFVLAYTAVRVGHSPARYNVPGRAIIDESNTFFYGETNLDGVLNLVSRSKKPVQELAWASIGNVLTAIQICEAHDRGVLVPWNSWRHEFYKPMGTLHDADRGGFIFAPEVGVHEDVHELDFSSLYPNIICTRNVSPDVIRCECHRDRSDVPELDYAICDEQGYLVDVFQPLIDARDEIKAEIQDEQERDSPDGNRIAALEGRSAALKWIFVACFGYQGFNNAKFGRIECHEAINVFAREILLTAKAQLEDGGWRVVHGIVDSIWVIPDPDTAEANRTPISELAATITDAVDIRLEHEAHYEWVAFVPQRDRNVGALTKYFGKTAGEDTFKVRGIEARQRSTPPFVADTQRACLEQFDATRSSEGVLSVGADALSELHNGRVASERLVGTKRVSKPIDGYTRDTRTVSALKRAREHGSPSTPGKTSSTSS